MFFSDNLLLSGAIAQESSHSRKPSLTPWSSAPTTQHCPVMYCKVHDMLSRATCILHKQLFNLQELCKEVDIPLVVMVGVSAPTDNAINKGYPPPHLRAS